VDLDHLVEIFFAHVVKHLVAQDPCVIDQYVDRPELVQSLPE
jgi:hypothetical protein